MCATYSGIVLGSFLWDVSVKPKSNSKSGRIKALLNEIPCRFALVAECQLVKMKHPGRESAAVSDTLFFLQVWSTNDVIERVNSVRTSNPRANMNFLATQNLFGDFHVESSAIDCEFEFAIKKTSAHTTHNTFAVETNFVADMLHNSPENDVAVRITRICLSVCPYC